MSFLISDLFPSPFPTTERVQRLVASPGRRPADWYVLLCYLLCITRGVRSCFVVSGRAGGPGIRRSARRVGLRLDKPGLCLFLILTFNDTHSNTRTHAHPHHTDSQGRVVNFKNTIIILTSNLGAEHLQKAALDSSTGKCVSQAALPLFLAPGSFICAPGLFLLEFYLHICFTFPPNKGNLSDDEDMASNGGGRSNKKSKKEVGDVGISEDVRGKVMAAVRRHFRPEFLNRYVLCSSVWDLYVCER